MKREKRCETCACWEQYPETPSKWGQCHYYAPRCVGTAPDDWQWPETHAETYCIEGWRPREP
jgi:hypothetical protein